MNTEITNNESDEDLSKQNGKLASEVFNDNVTNVLSRNETLQSCNARESSKNIPNSHVMSTLFGSMEAANSFDILESGVRLKKRKNNKHLDNDLKKDEDDFHKTEQHNFHPPKTKELIKRKSHEADSTSAQNEENDYVKHNKYNTKNDSESVELTNKKYSSSSEKIIVQELPLCTDETKKKFDTFSHRHQPRTSVFPLNSNQKYQQKSYSDGYLDSSLNQHLTKYEREGIKDSTAETIDTTTQTEKAPEGDNEKKPSKKR